MVKNLSSEHGGNGETRLTQNQLPKGVGVRLPLFRPMNKKKLTHYDPTIKVNGPYLNRTQNRKFVQYVYADKRKRVITYAKYLMEQLLKRELSSEEEVDHIDRNKLNDVIENLQILNKNIHIILDAKRAKLVEIECVRCHKKCMKKTSSLRSNSKSGYAGPFCGKKCTGEYGADIKYSVLIKLPIQPSVESEYYYLDKLDGYI